MDDWNDARLADRALGALVGLAIGDVLNKSTYSKKYSGSLNCIPIKFRFRTQRSSMADDALVEIKL